MISHYKIIQKFEYLFSCFLIPQLCDDVSFFLFLNFINIFFSLYFNTTTMGKTVDTNDANKSKQLLIETSLAVEDLLDVSKTMLEGWKEGDDRQKKKIGGGLEQLLLCLNQINSNLKESFRLTGDATLANSETSRIRAETNLKLKRDKILNTSTRGMSNAEFRLNKILTNAYKNKKRPNPFESINPRKKRNTTIQPKVHPVLQFAMSVKPSDGQLYSIYEIVHGMMVDEKSLLYGQSTNQVMSQLSSKGRIGFKRATLQRHVKTYKTNGTLPPVDYDAMRVGRPPKVQKEEDTPSLNNVVHQNIGMLAGSSNLTSDILDLSVKQKTVTH
jgi:hypothetical protein